MPDLRPRLVKSKTAPLAQAKAIPTPKAVKVKGPKFTPPKKRIDYAEHRRLELERFERRLSRHPEKLLRRQEVLPFFRAMIESGVVRSRPVSRRYRHWLFSVDIETAALDLFRVVYDQHCAEITWRLDDAV